MFRVRFKNGEPPCVRSSIQNVFVLVCLIVWICSGCVSSGGRLGSKWAMDHPDYANKYDRPYGPNRVKNWGRMAKQSVDARFQSGESGLYVSAGAATRHPAAAAGEIGLFLMPSSWATGRLGLVGLLAEGQSNYLTGGTAGIQFQFPTRLTPYAGLSGFAGVVHDDTTDNSSGFSNNPGPTTTNSGGMAAIIPEAGIHYWVNSRFRLSVGANYYITTEGRNEDFVLLGFSLAITGRNTDPGQQVFEASPELREVLEAQGYFREDDPLRPDTSRADDAVVDGTK